MEKTITFEIYDAVMETSRYTKSRKTAKKYFAKNYDIIERQIEVIRESEKVTVSIFTEIKW